LWQFWRNWVNASSSTGDRASCKTTPSWFICWQASKWKENIHTIFMFLLKHYNLCSSMSLCWMKNLQYRLLLTCSILTLSKPRLMILIQWYLKIHFQYCTLDIRYLSTKIWEAKFKCTIQITNARSNVIQFITLTCS
jgi:hypothetical protein